MTRKKKKKTFLTVFIILIILLGLGSLFYFGVFQQTGFSQCYGGSTYSISNVQISSNFEQGNGYIRITATANNKGECARVFTSSNKDQIIDSVNSQLSNSQLSSSAENEIRNVLIDVIPTKQTKTFYARNLNNNVYQIESKLYGNRALGFCTKSICSSKFSGSALGTYQSLGYIVTAPCYCVMENPVGTIGDFKEESDTRTELSVYLNGNKKATIYTNLENNAIVSKTSDSNLDSDVYVKYQGGFVTGRDLDVPNFVTYWQNGQFSMVQPNALTLILNAKQTYTNCVGFQYSYATTPQCISSYQSQLTNALNSNIAESQFNQNNLVQSFDIQGSSMVVTLNDQVEFPTLIIDLKGDYAEIIKVSGKPDITNCQNNFEMNSGEIKTVSFSVKNTGSNTGSFDANLICEGMPQPLSDSNKVVNKGSSANFNAQISLITSETKTFDCDFTVQDVNSGDTDSCSFDIKVKKVTGCSTDICSSDFKNLLECQNDGTYKEIDCEFGCELTTSGAECKDKEDEEQPEEDLYCKPTFELGLITILPAFEGERPSSIKTFLGLESKQCFGTFQQIIFFLAIIILLISPLVVYRLGKKFKLFNNKALGSIISIIIGVVLYILVLNYLLWGIIFTVLIIIINSLIKSAKKKVGLQ